MKEFKDTYRPLPNGLTIMESKIEGLGFQNMKKIFQRVRCLEKLMYLRFNYKKGMGTNSTWWIYKP